ncbi:uncharacterized protein LOC107003787 [Solanum pennellii]|uniref:Uncharacterized protein LOC107003787 n=1 Tax=Solanum pennellii TaxID=28526 RepID=A0ABM1FJ00_SOLPN|nr:uncharacterized protein LOC107003787 [Solanum pennellii]
MSEYEACVLGLNMAIDMNVHELLVFGDSDLLIHQVRGQWAIKNPKITPYVQYIQKLCRRFKLKEHPVYYSHVEAEQDGLPWYFDIKQYLETGTYYEDSTSNHKKSIRRMTLNFFLSGGIL